MKEDAHIINLDEYESIEAHWIALYVNTKYVTYFDSFRVKHNPKENKKLIGKICYNKCLYNAII